MIFYLDAGGAKISTRAHSMLCHVRLRRSSIVEQDCRRRCDVLGWLWTSTQDAPTGDIVTVRGMVHQVRKLRHMRMIHMSNCEEGLGREMYVAGTLEHELLFLAPLYRFASRRPRGSIRAIPLSVSFFLKCMIVQIR